MKQVACYYIVWYFELAQFKNRKKASPRLASRGTLQKRKRWTDALSESLTKITEFLDFGATFDLDRIFSFFFILKVGARHPPLQNRVFGRCLKNGKVAPKCHI